MSDRPACPHCGGTDPYRHGNLSDGRPRWCCTGCERTFSGTRRTDLRDRLRAATAEIVAMRLERKSWDEIGARYGCRGETVRIALLDVSEIQGIKAPTYLEAKRLERGGGYLSRSGETLARKAAKERREAENVKFKKWPESLAKPREARQPALAPVKRASKPLAPPAPILSTAPDPLRQPRRLHAARDWELRRAAAVLVPQVEPIAKPEDAWPTGPVCQQPPADCDRCLRPLPLMRRVGQTRHFECRGKAAPPVGITRVAGLEQRA